MADQEREDGARLPVRRHLITPGAPPIQRTDPMDLNRVQRWVLSTLTATTIGHFAGGLVVAAVFLDETRNSSRVGLLGIAAVVGMLAVVSALVCHQKSVVSAWLLLGLLPALVGAYFVLRR